MTFREDIKRPFNLLMIAIAIVSLFAAFYFYYFPKNNKGIAYAVEGPSLIYDSKMASPAIRLVDESNSPIKSDTYLETFTVWNTGSTPIEPSDVRKPIGFTFQGAERILDSKIVTSTDPDVSEFKVSNTNLEGKQFADTVFLTWKHFDPKKAVKFQVIYCQQAKPVTRISADIVGISKLQSGAKQKPWPDAILMAVGSVLLIFFVASILRDAFRSKNPKRWITIVFVILLAISFLASLFVFFAQKMFLPTPPPF
jgi:hypothetical protein